MIDVLLELWDDLPWYGRVVVFGMIPAQLLFLACLCLSAVAS